MSKRRTLQELTPDPVELRRCQGCGHDLSEAHYSMVLSNVKGRFGASKSKLICNGCLTERGTGYFSDSTTWQTRKACKPRDADLFFPQDAEAVEERAWQWICGSCPVRVQCLEFGVKATATGVYGGVYLEDGIETVEIDDPELLRARIVELYLQGVSGKSIGKSVGISMGKVFRELDKMGIPRRPR